jgi:GntR family transcriptional regulator
MLASADQLPTNLNMALKQQPVSDGSGSVATRTRTAILDAIFDGRWERRLPSETQLAEMLGVSRSSVRAALHDLEIDGLITRRRALGTTVNAHVQRTSLGLHRLIGFERLLSENGHTADVQVSWKIDSVPQMFTTAFNAGKGIQVLLMSKRYVVGGHAAIGIADAIPIDRLRDGRIPKAIPSSIFEFSRACCVEEIDLASASIVPMMSVKSGPLADSIKPGRPYVRLHETHYSRSGGVVGWSIIDVNDEYVRFDLVRRH